MILADAYELIRAFIIKRYTLAVNEDILYVVALGGFNGEFESFAARNIHSLGAYLASLGLYDIDFEIIGDLTVCIAVIAGIRVHPVTYRPCCGKGCFRRNVDSTSGSIQLIICCPAAEMISVVVDKRQAYLSAFILKNTDDTTALIAVKRRVADFYRAVIVDLGTAGRSDTGIVLNIERCAL